MLHQFKITFNRCGSCVSHSHCVSCCSSAVEDLLQKPCVQEASLDPVKKLLTLTATAHREDLIDLLDDMGIFTDE